jgi:plastocyanin
VNVRTRTVLVAGVASLAVAIPATADAKTKTVTMGPKPSQQKTLGATVNNPKTDFVDVNDFFPHGVTVHVGDKVKFKDFGFHTVDMPAKGEGVLGLVAPTGTNVSGANDALGHPFWFNGQPNFGFNKALLVSKFGKRVRYSGKKRAASGLPQGPPNTFTVKFTKAGKYRYFCDIHPHMSGTVRVRPKSKSIPSAKADRRRSKKQFKRALKIAKRIRHTEAPANTVDVGAHGSHSVEYYQMFPKTLTVPVHTLVNFRMMSGSTEDHSATFGPAAYLQPIAGPFANPAPPDFALDPRGVYQSEAPGTTASLSPALHGNGFWNSGVMDQDSATPLPTNNSVEFDTPGTYVFECLIHTNMKGTIKVVPATP